MRFLMILPFCRLQIPMRVYKGVCLKGPKLNHLVIGVLYKTGCINHLVKKVA